MFSLSVYTWGIFLIYIRHRLSLRLCFHVFWEVGHDTSLSQVVGMDGVSKDCLRRSWRWILIPSLSILSCSLDSGLNPVTLAFGGSPLKERYEKEARECFSLIEIEKTLHFEEKLQVLKKNYKNSLLRFWESVLVKV